MSIKKLQVACEFTKTLDYPRIVPFNPPEKYPELINTDVDLTNSLYAEIRNILFHIGMDKDNFNSSNWNPFGQIVKPGMTVFIKPNTVTHSHQSGGNILSIIVHGSILRPILDYVCIALKGTGKIIIGDSQLYDADFDIAQEISGIGPLLYWYRSRTQVQIECFDLRHNRAVRTILYGRWGRKKIDSDPRGYTFVDLGSRSYFDGIDPKKLRIGIGNHKNMYKNHSGGHHRYLFPNSFLQSDVVINLPKLKTHRRTGVTLAIKNFMGLASYKDSLPHFTIGSPGEGGDQYIHPSFRKRIGTWMHDRIQSSPFLLEKFLFAVIKKITWNSSRLFPFKDDVFEAMWPGNDTVWRTLFDLNRIALYADSNGMVQPMQQRHYFCLMDGIIGGEGDGPVACDDVKAGLLIAGYNPIAVDCVATITMGFDPGKIKLIDKGFGDVNGLSPLFFGKKDDITIIDNGSVKSLFEFSKDRNLHFKPHPAWAGSIERDDKAD